MLHYNEAFDTYFLYSNDRNRAIESGLTLSTSARGPNGELCWYTASPDDDKRPIRNSYAVLPFYEQGTDIVKQKLYNLWKDYEKSWSLTSSNSYDCPVGEQYDPYQIASIDYALQHRKCIIGDPPGVGKAQPLSSKVKIPGGWKAIGDLKVGDGVSGYNGSGGRVVGVYDRGIMDVYEITFSDGYKTRVSEDHLWLVKTSNESKFFVAPTWLIKEKIKTLKISIPLTQPVGGQDGNYIPIDPYLCGLLIGDGGLSQQSVYISNTDKEIVKYCASIAVKYNTKLKHCDRCTYRFSSGKAGVKNELRRRLNSIGLKCRSEHKFIPKCYMNAKPVERLDILRGIMDSDGWVQKGRAFFATTSERLCDDVAEIIQSLGGTCRKSYKRNKHLGSWNLSINISVCPFKISKKADNWKVNIKYRPKRLFKNIEFIGREQVRCIEVTCKDRLYLTDNYIVTHNTVQALGLANAINARRVLVFCPAAIRKQWCRQIRRWTMLPNPIVHPIFKSSNGVNPKANFVVASYNMAINDGIHKALMSHDWDLVITDEGHFLKNYDAKRTKAIFGGGNEFKHNFIADRSEYVISLTGTPLPNRPREAYTHARAMDWSCIDFLSEDMFKYRFNPSARIGSNNHIKEETGREAELGARLRCNIMVRREKEQLLPFLPDKRFEMCYIEDNGAIRDVLAQEKLIDFDPDRIRNPDFVIDDQISTLRREMGEAKVPRIIEHMKYLFDIVEKPKVVLFCYHRNVMVEINNALSGYGLTCIMGGMSPIKKQDSIDRFVNDPLVRTINVQIEAGGFGVDELQQVCDHAVYGEIAWTHGTNEQALDRLHRRGQHRNVLGQILMVEGSLDEKMVPSVIDKAITVHKVLDKRY